MVLSATFFPYQSLTYLILTLQEADSHKLPNLGPTILWKDFAVLEAHYSDNNFPDPMDIGFIARRLQVDPLSVHLWFKVRFFDIPVILCALVRIE